MNKAPSEIDSTSRLRKVVGHIAAAPFFVAALFCIYWSFVPDAGPF